MGEFTPLQENLNTLQAIFEQHREDRICVVGTTCCGKSTLLKQIPNCIDMDEALWPLLTPEEEEFICQKPWTEEIGKYFDQLIYRKVEIVKGKPMFGTTILDCDVVVYLDIEDILLAERCRMRNVDFKDAKSMKVAIENDYNKQRLCDDKKFYYVMITE